MCSERPAAVPRRAVAGFTILELGLVVVVVTVLAAIVMATTGGIAGQGREIDCHDELRTVKVAVANYFAIVDRQPDSTAALTTGKDPVRRGHYLASVPRWYAVGANGDVTLRPGAPSACPRP